MLRSYLKVDVRGDHESSQESSGRNDWQVEGVETEKDLLYSPYSGQENGLALIQCIERFFKNPQNNYEVPLQLLQEWFSETSLHRRQELAKLFLNLLQEQGLDIQQIIGACGDDEEFVNSIEDHSEDVRGPHVDDEPLTDEKLTYSENGFKETKDKLSEWDNPTDSGVLKTIRGTIMKSCIKSTRPSKLEEMLLGRKEEATFNGKSSRVDGRRQWRPGVLCVKSSSEPNLASTLIPVRNMQKSQSMPAIKCDLTAINGTATAVSTQKCFVSKETSTESGSYKINDNKKEVPKVPMRAVSVRSGFRVGNQILYVPEMGNTLVDKTSSLILQPNMELKRKCEVIAMAEPQENVVVSQSSSSHTIHYTPTQSHLSTPIVHDKCSVVYVRDQAPQTPSVLVQNAWSEEARKKPIIAYAKRKSDSKPEVLLGDNMKVLFTNGLLSPVQPTKVITHCKAVGADRPIEVPNDVVFVKGANASDVVLVKTRPNEQPTENLIFVKRPESGNLNDLVLVKRPDGVNSNDVFLVKRPDAGPNEVFVKRPDSSLKDVVLLKRPDSIPASDIVFVKRPDNNLNDVMFLKKTDPAATSVGTHVNDVFLKRVTTDNTATNVSDVIFVNKRTVENVATTETSAKPTLPKFSQTFAQNFQINSVPEISVPEISPKPPNKLTHFPTVSSDVPVVLEEKSLVETPRLGAAHPVHTSPTGVIHSTLTVPVAPLATTAERQPVPASQPSQAIVNKLPRTPTQPPQQVGLLIYTQGSPEESTPVQTLLLTTLPNGSAYCVRLPTAPGLPNQPTRTVSVPTPPSSTIIKKTEQPVPVVPPPECNKVALMKDLKEFENVFEETKLKFEKEKQQHVDAEMSQSPTPPTPEKVVVGVKRKSESDIPVVTRLFTTTAKKPLIVVTSYAQPQTTPTRPVVTQSCSSPTSKISKGKIRSGKTFPTPQKSPPTPKPQQKPQEDEKTQQKIYAILEEYAVQKEHSPDTNNRPAPRRRSNPPSTSTSKKKRPVAYKTTKDAFGEGDDSTFSEM